MKSITLKDLLRATITEVERSTELDPDHRALSELKHSLIRSVAELDVQREREPQLEADHDAVNVYDGV